jgi:hypothetical protein
MLAIWWRRRPQVQPGVSGDRVKATIVGVLGQIGRDRQDLEVMSEVLWSVVHEHGATRIDAQVHDAVAAVTITTVLGEELTDMAVHAQLLCPFSRIVPSTRAPQDHPAPPCQVLEELPGPGAERRPGQRIHEAAVDVEDPAVHGRRRAGPRVGVRVAATG